MKMTLAPLAAALAATSAFAQTAPSETPATTPPAAAMAPAPANPAEATPRDALAAAGFTDVRTLVRDGDGWKGTAMHKGKRVPVKVAADGRIVSPQM